MAKSAKPKLVPQARALYAEGSSKPVIAESLKVSVRTVRRWAQEEAAAGRPWRRGPSGSEEPPRPSSRAAAPRRASGGARGPGSLPERLCRRLEERLEELMEKSKEADDDPRLEERMLRICKVLEYLRAEADDISAQLVAMKRFVTFCLRTLSEDEMAPVRKAVRLFVDALRKEHS
ncbi:MAG: helix-turn-helix domain-containing protein [Candidatus Brocadiae bacterium]|nr:helix-turn-helix domain-containing protein [Candidatus Brocadiia bacterium]